MNRNTSKAPVFGLLCFAFVCLPLGTILNQNLDRGTSSVGCVKPPGGRRLWASVLLPGWTQPPLSDLLPLLHTQCVLRLLPGSLHFLSLLTSELFAFKVFLQVSPWPVFLNYFAVLCFHK